MKKFESDYTGLLSRKYTIGLDRRYTDIFSKIDNAYVKKGLALIDEVRPGYGDAMAKWKERQSEAEVYYEYEKMRYYGCRSIYGILWYIIQAC